MKKVLITFFSTVTLTLGATSAHAYCRAPGRAPEAPSAYDKPQQPPCMRNARYGEEAECSRIQIERYRRDAQRYMDLLDAYAEEARIYAKDAAVYAHCEAVEIRETMR